jgi:hypothetical protein
MGDGWLSSIPDCKVVTLPKLDEGRAVLDRLCRWIVNAGHPFFIFKIQC